MKTPAPEHFRESLPLFQQHIKEELCQSHAAKRQENLAAVQGPLLSVHGAEAARNTAIQQSAGHSTSITSAQSGVDRAHARKSDGPNSHKAAQSVTNLGRTRDEILRILKHYGPQADEQIIYAFRKCGMNAASTCELCRASDSGIRSRRSELVTMGFVHEVGTGKTKSGRPCAIWALKERKT